MNCSYCNRTATHLGEGERVCEKHVHEPAKGEYISLVPCEECGNSDTMPPYTSEKGTHFPGYYCEGCGHTTYTETSPRPTRTNR